MAWTRLLIITSKSPTPLLANDRCLPRASCCVYFVILDALASAISNLQKDIVLFAVTLFDGSERITCAYHLLLLPN